MPKYARGSVRLINIFPESKSIIDKLKRIIAETNCNMEDGSPSERKGKKNPSMSYSTKCHRLHFGLKSRRRKSTMYSIQAESHSEVVRSVKEEDRY
jgi:hypothetical protein